MCRAGWCVCRTQGRQPAGAQGCYSSREGPVRGLQPMPSHRPPCLRDPWEPPPLSGALCRAATSLMGLEGTKIPLKMPKPALRNGGCVHWGGLHVCGQLILSGQEQGRGACPWGGWPWWWWRRWRGCASSFPLLPVHPRTYTDAETITVIIPTMVTVTVAEMPAS